ncbi:MAG: rhomboid family intramembrane serine protease [bacterium]|nr:rhomboid family intramembrane serine protease [bacterium]
MRVIGTLENEEQSRIFCDYLTQLHIENQMAIEPDGTSEIWIISEDDVKRATQLLEKFVAAPEDDEYIGATQKAEEIRKQERKEQRRDKKSRAAYIDVRTSVFNRGWASRGRLTLFLIGICGIVAVLSGMGDNFEFVKKLFISEYINPTLPEIKNGHFWRLITPIFIHFGPIHLIFNMLCLYDLGNMIEARKGSLFLGIFVTINAAGSNLLQYIVASTGFGGMSGVVYGLLGYIWMKGKYDPSSRMVLHKSTVTMMIAWFFLCFTGLMGNVANGAHAGGLAIGAAWGFITSPKFKNYFNK